MTPPLIFGPTPPYSNPPIEPQFFKPKVFFISAISLGKTTIVTTTTDQDYVIGQLCRILIPYGFGARLLNEQTGYVISIPALNQIELTIDSSGYEPFIINPLFTTQPTINAIGDVNNGYISNTGRVLINKDITGIPGSFQNISPL